MILFAMPCRWSRCRRASRRGGAVLLAALVCLLIAVALIAQMLRVALQMQRQLPKERDLVQCEFLLQAGVDRAEALARASADYRGETREIALPGSAYGRGLIRIEVSRDSAGSRQVAVRAEYPAGDPHSVCRSRQFTLPPAIAQP